MSTPPCMLQKGWREWSLPPPVSVSLTASAAFWPTVESTSTSWPTTRPLKKPAICFGTASCRRPPQLKELHQLLAEERKLDASIINLLRTAPRHALPMDVLRTAVSALSFYDVEEKSNDREANVHKAIRLTSQVAMIVAAYDRIRKGKSVVEPDRALSHAANFLLMLNGNRLRRPPNARSTLPSSCMPTTN